MKQISQTQNPSVFIQSHDVNNTSSRGERNGGSLNVSMGDVTPPTWETGSVYHFTPLSRRSVGYLVFSRLFLPKPKFNTTILQSQSYTFLQDGVRRGIGGCTCCFTLRAPSAYRKIMCSATTQEFSMCHTPLEPAFSAHDYLNK